MRSDQTTFSQSVLTYRKSFFLAVFSFPLILAIGCQKKDEIVVHHLPKLNNASDDGEMSDRMVVGMAFDKGSGWYFKLVGKQEFVDEAADPFLKFLRTVEFTDEANPNWTAPDEWQEIPPSSSMRKATFLIGEEELELAITSFPLVGGVEEGLLANVNRWRGHMSLDPVGVEKIGESLEELSDAKETMLVMDVIGKFNGGMSANAPFMNAAKSRSSPHGDSPPSPAPAEVPPTVERPDLDFELPDDWVKGTASMFSVYAFELDDEEGQAKVSISSMTKTNTWESSLGMWKGQLGQAKMSDEDAEKLTKSISIDGLEGKLILIESPKDSDKPQAMIGVRIEKDSSAWFFKVSGDNKTVLAHQEEFETFLKSIKFK